MATLLFKYPNAKIGSLELDASITEGHSAEVEATEHPVEKGANISDHARVKPETLQMEGLISATPIGKDPGLDYIETAYATLRKLKDARELLTIVTALRTYDNMMLVKLDVPRDAHSGDALRFTATFKEIRLAEVQSIQVQTRKVPKAKGKTKTGAAVAPPVKEEEVRTSLLQEGVDHTIANKRLNVKPHFIK